MSWCQQKTKRLGTVKLGLGNWDCETGLGKLWTVKTGDCENWTMKLGLGKLDCETGKLWTGKPETVKLGNWDCETGNCETRTVKLGLGL